MKKNIPTLSIICLLLISCNVNPKVVDEKFIGAWVADDIQSVNGHQPTLADTSEGTLKGHMLIIKKSDTDQQTLLVNYESDVAGYRVYKVEDDNTLFNTMEPEYHFESRIKYDSQTGHIIYNMTDNPAAGHEFIKLQ